MHWHPGYIYPSVARRMAGSRTSATLSFPLPNASTVSTQAAAAPAFNPSGQSEISPHTTKYYDKTHEPGTVTELRSVVGIPSVIPRKWRYSMFNFSGARPDPFSALTVLVLAS